MVKKAVEYIEDEVEINKKVTIEEKPKEVDIADYYIQDSDICGVCKQRKKNVKNNKCGHFIYCRRCFSKINSIDCPECAWYQRYYGFEDEEKQNKKKKSKRTRSNSPETLMTNMNEIQDMLTKENINDNQKEERESVFEDSGFVSSFYP